MAARSALALLTLLAAAPAAASAAPHSPAASGLRAVDAAGREVVLQRIPARIATVFSSNTEIVAALGLGARIVAIDGMTTYPPEVLDRARVGGRLGLSVEAVVAQRPDLVLLTPARQAMHQLLLPLERLGVPTVVLMSRDLEELLSNVRLVAHLTGTASRGAALEAGLRRRLAEVDRRTRGLPRPSVVMITGLVGGGMVLIARDDSYTGDAIRASGARSALRPPAGWSQVSPEAIRIADPDVLLFAGRDADLERLVRAPGWRALRAVRTGRAFTVPRSEFLIPGPRTFDGIERLARRLHPVAFAAP